MKRLKQFFRNALILSGTTILMRIISVAFNAYAAAKIGAEGMGLFSLISSVYLFAVTLATSGIHLAVTMLVSEELGRGNDAAAHRAVHVCIRTAVCFGGSAALLLFFGAGIISEHILGDPRTYLSLRAFAVALPFIALSNVFSGYFSAVRRVAKNASSAIIEQGIKITVTVSLLLSIAPRGIEYACLALVLGTAVSEALSFLYLFFLYRSDAKRHLDIKHGKIPSDMTKRALRISMPLALSSYLRSGLVTVEQILIPIGLQKSGADYTGALSCYGIIHGMAFPLILFPSALCSAFAGLIVPELSELAARYEYVHGNRHICYIVQRALCGALFFSIGIAGVFYCFAEPLGVLIYQNEEVSHYLALFAPLVPIMYLDTAVDGMLKGLGQQLPCMIINIIDAATSVFLVWSLLPQMGIRGYILCAFLTETLNLALSLYRLLAVTGARLPVFKAICGPTVCIAGATSLASLMLRAFPIHSPLVIAIFGIGTASLLYLILLRSTHTLSGEDTRWIQGIFR